MLGLGYAYLSSLSLPAVAEPHLEWLAHEVNESSSMSVLDGHDIVYVARVPTSRIMTVAINVGTRFPAYATSMGRVLLAGLDDGALEAHLDRLDLEGSPRARSPRRRAPRPAARDPAQGYALVDQELEYGLRSLAAPVRDRTGSVVAAVNVSSHVSRITRERARRELLPPLLHAVSEIETDLSRTDEPGPDGEHHAHPGRHRRRRPRRAAAVPPARPGRGRLGPRGEPLAGLRAGRIRAGILESSSVDLLTEVGLGERIAREGDEHRGIYLRWPDEKHHVDFVDHRAVGVGLRADRGHQGPDGRPGASRPAASTRSPTSPCTTSRATGRR